MKVELIEDIFVEKDETWTDDHVADTKKKCGNIHESHSVQQMKLLIR